MTSLVADPEPCDDCDTGISYITCHDGIRRCKNCVHRYAAFRGWDRPDDPPEPSLVLVPPPPPPPLPPMKMSRKALQAEKELRAAEAPQQPML